MNRIESPMAIASVRWLTAQEGGRRSGPPTAPVYMATSVFVEGDEDEVQPGWPASADQLSILLEPVKSDDVGRTRCVVGFLAPDLARASLRQGAELRVLEGPRVVAHARVERLLGPTGEAHA